MKKLLILLIILFPLFANAQEKQAVVTLKNGTELKGIIKSINPTESLVIIIAGIETKIMMTDVARVEELSSNNNDIADETTQTQLNKDKDKKLIVTDRNNYQESFDLKIGKETIKMILVRGGDMNMGFDGKHSLSMNSEPVHKVGVTSFYISETFVTSSIVSEVSIKSGKKDYYKTTWKKANEIVQSIANKVGLPIRLPLEAEWEYAACSQEQEKIFGKCSALEFCNDWYDEYKDTEYRVDPKGPNKGKHGLHVIRSYSHEKGKLSRAGGADANYNFRLVIKAKDLQ